MVKPSHIALGGYMQRPLESNTTGYQCKVRVSQENLCTDCRECTRFALWQNTLWPYGPMGSIIFIVFRCALNVTLQPTLSSQHRSNTLSSESSCRLHMCAHDLVWSPRSMLGILVLIIAINVCGVCKLVIVVFLFLLDIYYTYELSPSR